ncbi:MAG TPA: hypothetical protein VGM53_28240 [Streptosporangiaceae bacterium]|jgi:hypothetical protein
MTEPDDAPARVMAERVRDAFGAATQTITAQDLPARPAPAGDSRAARRVRAWPTRLRVPALAPVVAAACVAAIAVTGTVVVPKLLSGPVGQPAAGLAGAPAFFAGVSEQGGHGTLRTAVNIYSSATGKTVASLSPPGRNHDFTAVARLGGDQTFVAAAVTSFQTCSSRLYRFAIDARGRPSGLIPLSVPPVRGQVGELVGSAAGNVLAFTASGGCTGHQGEAGMIRVASGQLTTWTYPSAEFGSLSLTADGSVLGFAASKAAWILPTSAPSGPLTSHARKVLQVPTGVFRMALNRTGSQAYVETQGGSRRHPDVLLTLYSTATGHRIRLLGRLGPGRGQLFSELPITVDAAARHMIVYGYANGTPAIIGRSSSARRPRPEPVTEVNLSTGRHISVPVTREPYLDAPFDTAAW